MSKSRISSFDDSSRKQDEPVSMGLGLLVSKETSGFTVKSAMDSSPSESNSSSPALKRRLKIFEEITTEKYIPYDEEDSEGLCDVTSQINVRI